MDSPRNVLDYAPPPRPLRRVIAYSLTRSLQYLCWFILHRPIHAHEVFVTGWLFFAGWWVAQALGPRWTFLQSGLAYSVAGAILVVAWAGLVRTIARRRWRLTAICVSMAIVSGMASGLVQLDQCPHAIYLQVCGASIPVVGKACSNPRDYNPWWIRD